MKDSYMRNVEVTYRFASAVAEGKAIFFSGVGV